MGKGLGRAILIAYLDTHVAVYLAEGTYKRLSLDAKRMIDRAELLISPMAVVEMEILSELRKIKMSARDIKRKLEHEIGVSVCEIPFPHVADVALEEAWTRDPFDRIIVSQAKANGFAYLISADEEIAQHYPRTVW